MTEKVCKTPLVARGNVGLNSNQAMLFSDNTQLASRSADSKGVWAFVPDTFSTDKPQLLVYYHGNDYFVTATVCDGVVAGYAPDWWTSKTNKLATQGSCGHYYQFDTIGSLVTSSNLPLVLLPEDGMPSGSTFGGGTATADAMVNDCLSGLAALPKPAGGAKYISKSLQLSDIKRLFLMGHSGGGKTVIATSTTALTTNTPTTLCVYDGTYEGHVAEIKSFATKRAIGMAADQNRAVFVYTTGGNDRLSPSGKAKKIANAKAKDPSEKQAPSEDDYAHDGKGKRIFDYWTRDNTLDCVNALKALFPGVTCPQTVHTTADVTAALSKYAVVCVESEVAHDNIPQKYYPMILAASPSP